MCWRKERNFFELVRLYDVDENYPGRDAVSLNSTQSIRVLTFECTLVKEALDDFVDAAKEIIDDHGDALGSGEVEALKASIKDAEKEFTLLINKLSRPKPNGIEFFSPASLSHVQSNYEAQTESAQVNIDTDADITRKENKNEASDEEEAEITHHTSTAESTNDDDSHEDENEAEVMDQGTIGNDKIIQSSSCGKDVAEERTLVIEKVRNVSNKIPEDTMIDFFDDIPEKVEETGSSMEVDDKDEDATEGEVVNEVRFAFSADTPKLKSRLSLREDLEVAEKTLNTPIVVATTDTDDEQDRNDVCSEVMDDDVSNDLSYWYKKVQNDEETEATAINSLSKLFDPGPNELLVKESPELNPDGIVYIGKRKADVTTRQVIMSKDIGRTDRAVDVEVNCFVHDMAKVEKVISGKAANNSIDKPEVVTVSMSCVCCCPGHCKFSVQWVTGSLMGVNTAIKVDTDTDSEQLEFTTFFEKHTIEDEDSDVPVKFSELAKKDELYDVITSLETDFNLDLVEMFLIRHESYIFMTAWSCSRRLVPNLQVRIT